MLDLIFDPRALRIDELTRAFNPFRVLRVETYELRHANTLAWLLAPAGSHGLGNAFLSQFLKRICEEDHINFGTGRATLSRIALDDLDGVHVRTEVATAELAALAKSEVEAAIDGTLERQPAEASGRLDVLVEGKDWVVGVEAKVRAGLHGNQLSNYQRSLEQGAATYGRVLVLLSNDDSLSGPTPWNSVTWDAVVAEPLKLVLDRLPQTRQNEPQIAFLRSFAEVVDENCRPPQGVREELLSELVRDYAPLLAELRGQLRAGTLTDADRKLIKRHSSLIDLMAKRYQPESYRRESLLHDVVSEDGRFDLAVSTMRYVRFIPKTWSEFPWLPVQGKPRDFGVLYELINDSTAGVQFKIQIRYLGIEDGNRQSRLRFLELVRDDPRHEVQEVFPRVFTNAGFRSPHDKYFTVFSSQWLPSPQADDKAALSNFVATNVNRSLELLTELLHSV